jgi:hypothetical protein
MPPLALDAPPPVIPPEGEEVPVLKLDPPAMPVELDPLEPAWLLEELALLLLLMPPLLLDPPLALAPP